jgi:predicted peptidase
MIVVAPQCRPRRQFDPDDVLVLVDHIIEEFHVDVTRIYLTGYSLGGRGTWDVAMANPERFAAIAPVCGAADSAHVEALKAVPVWAFHGAKDCVIPIRSTQTMINALQAAGGHARLTIYSDRGHDIGGLIYGNAELYMWLLSQRRNE